MFVKTYAGALVGIDAVEVAVEVNLSTGTELYLVGLPDNAVRESLERIRSAFENCERRVSGKKIVVNLAPADLRKEGSAFDLPIAVGILGAMEQVVVDDGPHPEQEMTLSQIRVDEHSPFLNRTMKEAGVRDRYHCLIAGVERGSDVLHALDPHAPFQLGDVVWVVGEKKNVYRLSGKEAL